MDIVQIILHCLFFISLPKIDAKGRTGTYVYNKRILEKSDGSGTQNQPKNVFF